MTPLIGAACIFAVALIWGRDRVKKEEQRIAVLRGLLKFVTFVKDEIANFRTPLDKIFESFSVEALTETRFSEYLVKGDTDGAVDSLKGKIPDDALRELSVFLAELGGGYCEGQVALCDVFSKRLDTCTTELLSTFNDRTRMYRLLPLLIAASVIILLI